MPWHASCDSVYPAPFFLPALGAELIALSQDLVGGRQGLCFLFTVCEPFRHSWASRTSGRVGMCSVPLDVKMVAVSDPFIPLVYMVNQLQYDSVHGRFNGTIAMSEERSQAPVLATESAPITSCCRISDARRRPVSLHRTSMRLERSLLRTGQGMVRSTTELLGYSPIVNFPRAVHSTLSRVTSSSG